LSPLFYIESAATYGVAAFNLINERANLLEATEIRDEAALDSYTFTREAFLQRRKDLIYDGNPPVEEFEDFFEEEAEDDSMGLATEDFIGDPSPARIPTWVPRASWVRWPPLRRGEVSGFPESRS